MYILASRSRTLYTGVTSNLQRRMIEHREKEIKGWRRKKIWLIERDNPTWEDLAERLGLRSHAYEGRQAKAQKADPSPPSAKPGRPGSG